MLNVCPGALMLLQRAVVHPGRKPEELKLVASERQLRRWRRRLVEVGFVRWHADRTIWPTTMGVHVAQSRAWRMHTLPISYQGTGLGQRTWQVAHAVAHEQVPTLLHHPMLEGVAGKVIRRSRDIAWAYGLLKRKGGRKHHVQPTAEAIEWFKWWECQTSAAAK